MKEIWKSIDEYRSNSIRYEVSNFGAVRSIWYDYRRVMILKGTNSGCYECVRIGNKIYYKHRLVAKYFIPNPENKPQVNHIDGNKFNNHYKNLEWVTCKENINHSYRIGTSKTGEKRHLVKYTDNQVRQIRIMFSDGMRICDISRAIGINRCSVYYIAKGTTHKYVI